jgi:hypothetical protein
MLKLKNKKMSIERKIKESITDKIFMSAIDTEDLGSILKEIFVNSNTPNNQELSQDIGNKAVLGTDNKLFVAPDIDYSQQFSNLNDADIISGSVLGNNLVILLKNGQTINIDTTSFTADVRVTSGVYNPITKSLDFTLSNSNIINVPVSALLPVTTDESISGNGANNPLKVELSTNQNNGLTYGTDGKIYIEKQNRVNIICRNKLTQSLVANSWSALTGWVKIQDSNNNLNNTSGVFTAPRTGTYFFTLGNACQIPANQYYGLAIRKNSSQQLYNDLRYSGSSGIYYFSICGSIELNLGETITGYLYKGGNGNVNDVVTASNSWFTINEVNNKF